jgi:PAS domain S-box-containing protein
MTNPTYTVLIVDDLQTHRELFRNFLLTDSSCDYRILEAESVRAGIELHRISTAAAIASANATLPPTRAVDAILLDYSLPDGDGLEFLAELHAQSNGSSPPVVMITGRGDESIAVQAIKLGAQDYLVKSNLTPERLQSAVASAIESARLRLQLQQSNDLLRVSLDTMLDCFGIYSAIRDVTGQIIDFRFEYLNAAALESNHMTVADMSRGLCEVFPAQCETGLFEKYCQVVATGVPLIQDNLIYTDVFGTQQLTKAYDRRISKLNDGFVAAWRDMTVQIQAEQERDRFFDLSIDLLATGNFAGYFTRVNPAFERVLGFTSAELMAQPFLDFVHPDDLEHTIAGARCLSAGQMEVGFENRYRCKDGSYRLLSWNSIPYIERSLWYAVGRDITESKQTKAALEERNQELDNFVHIVSHDLKAPLRAVSNLSQWIEDDLEGKVLAATQPQLTLLRNRVDRMAATIDGLLDYARIGRTDELIEPVSVAELIAEAIDSLAPPPTFKIAIAPNLPTLNTKRLLLFQVFMNLIGNAIVHHDSSDGSIQISGQECGDFYEFGVTDDGPGIAPASHAKIFIIFQTVNPQNRANSTGIGLAIVKKIIEAEGGTIRLESELGRGTSFYFTWPKRSN